MIASDKEDIESEKKLQHLDDGWGAWSLITQDRKNAIKENANVQKVSRSPDTHILQPLC